MGYGSVVKLNGEFILGTKYGDNPLCLGLDLVRAEKNVRGLVRAARPWEISYLAEQHKREAENIPEARFSGDGFEDFYINLVQDPMECLRLGLVEISYDVQSDGEIVVIIPTDDLPQKGTIEDVIDKDVLEGRKRLVPTMERIIEYTIKCLDILEELKKIIPKKSRHRKSIPCYRDSFMKCIGTALYERASHEREKKARMFGLISFEDHLTSLTERAEADIERRGGKENPNSLLVGSEDVQAMKSVLDSEDPEKEVGKLKMGWDIKAVSHDLRIAEAIKQLGLDEDFAIFISSNIDTAIIDYVNVELLRRKYMRATVNR